MISIAVLGYGTVGSGVVEVLEKNKDVINQRAGDEISVKYVLDLRDFPGDPIQEKIVHDIDVIINDPAKPRLRKRKNIRKSDLINTKIPCAGSTYKRRTVQGIFLRESIINQLADIFLFNSSYLSDRQYHLL